MAQAGSFNSVDFCEPPRGILTLDEDVIISKNTRSDGDSGGAGWLVIQGGGQRWKLGSEVPGEISRWEEVCSGSLTQVELASCLYTDSCLVEHLPAYRVELS